MQTPNIKAWPLITQRELESEVIKSPKIVKRALKAGWIKPLVQGGRGRQSLFLPSMVDSLILRLSKGQMPPLLPCERRAAARRAR